ncbi:MAG: hypothetical protein MO853_14215 [Candidatus Protistobacter heckmanni]|nr:hypothetical protein [Candidatus Protistobacter heckmanni]
MVRAMTSLVTLTGAVGAAIDEHIDELERESYLSLGGGAVPDGQPGVHVEEYGANEVRAVATQFNRMVRAQETALATIHRMNVTLENEVTKRTSDLQAANESLEAFNFSVAHDLRTPLRQIDSYASLLERQPAILADSGSGALVERIRRSVERMGGLIDGLLRLVQISKHQLQLEDVNLTTLACEISEELQFSENGRRSSRSRSSSWFMRTRR